MAHSVSGEASGVCQGPLTGRAASQEGGSLQRMAGLGADVLRACTALPRRDPSSLPVRQVPLGLLGHMVQGQSSRHSSLDLLQRLLLSWAPLKTSLSCHLVNGPKQHTRVASETQGGSPEAPGLVSGCSRPGATTQLSPWRKYLDSPHLWTSRNFSEVEVSKFMSDLFPNPWAVLTSLE